LALTELSAILSAILSLLLSKNGKNHSFKKITAAAKTREITLFKVLHHFCTIIAAHKNINHSQPLFSYI
jgi:hypothetical protein